MIKVRRINGKKHSGIAIILLAVLFALSIAGCLGSSEKSPVEKADVAPSPQTTTDKSQESRDSHITDGVFGGYTIKGNLEGYGFKADIQKEMGVSPGGKPDIVGIIETGGKAIVYMDRDGASGADVRITRNGFSIAEWDIPTPESVSGYAGLFKIELNLNELKEKYDINQGDGISVFNTRYTPIVGVTFVIL